MLNKRKEKEINSKSDRGTERDNQRERGVKKKKER